MRSPAITVLALLASLTVAGCGEDNLSLIPHFQSRRCSQHSRSVRAASFNAALGAGTCTGQGTTTLAQFTAELAANHTVAAWQL